MLVVILYGDLAGGFQHFLFSTVVMTDWVGGLIFFVGVTTTNQRLKCIQLEGEAVAACWAGNRLQIGNHPWGFQHVSAALSELAVAESTTQVCFRA